MATHSSDRTTQIPYGYCHCTCGGKTSIIKQTKRAKGRVKGEPSRFLPGHNTRKHERYIEVPGPMTTPCWHWLLAKDRDGYGIVWSPAGSSSRAHRVYFEARFGPISHDRQLDHLCRNRCCVNPGHLEIVTAAENVRRGRVTKLTPHIVREIRACSDTQTVLARRYGVSQSQISRIRHNHTWRDLDPSGVV